jgi:hypothetical protein
MESVDFPGYDFVIQGGTDSPQGITLGKPYSQDLQTV